MKQLELFPKEKLWRKYFPPIAALTDRLKEKREKRFASLELERMHCGQAAAEKEAEGNRIAEENIEVTASLDDPKRWGLEFHRRYGYRRARTWLAYHESRNLYEQARSCVNRLTPDRKKLEAEYEEAYQRCQRKMEAYRGYDPPSGRQSSDDDYNIALWASSWMSGGV